MNILSAFFAAVFASFVIWLAIRIINRREKWAKQAAWGLAAVFIIYPLSSGPALWLGGDAQFVYALYRPLFLVVEYGPDWFAPIFLTYLSLFVSLPNC